MRTAETTQTFQQYGARIQYYGSSCGWGGRAALELQRQAADDALRRADDEQLVVDRLIGRPCRGRSCGRATSISHFAVLKSMNGSDWRTCTSKRESSARPIGRRSRRRRGARERVADAIEHEDARRRFGHFGFDRRRRRRGCAPARARSGRRREEHQVRRASAVRRPRARQRVLDRPVDAARDRRADAGAQARRRRRRRRCRRSSVRRAAGAPGMSTPNSVTS